MSGDVQDLNHDHKITSQDRQNWLVGCHGYKANLILSPGIELI